jgi:hypothetical protein
MTVAQEHRRPAFLLFWRGLELDLTRLRGKPLLAEALRMTGSAVTSIPVVAVLRIGALAQGPPPVAVNLLATSQPGPE